jgi:glycosyltransferase involved in cell wall biosynthesis
MIKISVHCLVKNEARFIWYSLTSVVDWVDRLRIVDTGSTDDTVKIINEFIKTYKGPTEIFFKQEVFKEKFDEKRFRDEMFNEDIKINDIDWILIVDGDEIWWNESIKKVSETIKKEGNKIESVIVPVCNLVGDMFHYQEKLAGRYQFKGLPKGHYNLRAYNKNIPGLHSKGEYGVFGWFDSDNKMIQERDMSKVRFVNAPYMHATHLQRSSENIKDLEVTQRRKKYKHEIGKTFAKDFYYPEAFFKSKSSIVSDSWERMNCLFKIQSYLETPLRMIKRRITA